MSLDKNTLEKLVEELGKKAAEEIALRLEVFLTGSFMKGIKELLEKINEITEKQKEIRDSQLRILSHFQEGLKHLQEGG